MVIVVPPFAKGQYRHPKTVGGQLAGDETLRAPHVRCGVHKPSGMQADDGAQKNATHYARPSADGVQDWAAYRNWHPMVLADPHIKFLLAQVRNIRQQFRSIL